MIRVKSFCVLAVCFAAFQLFGNSFTIPNIKGGAVLTVARKSNGDILLGGNFTQINEQEQAGIALLNSTGTLQPLATLNGSVNKVLVLASGKILVAGSFDTVSIGQTNYTRNCIFQLNSDGTMDTTFTSPFALEPNSEVKTIYDIVHDSINDKILIAGEFTKTIASQTFRHVLRLGNTGVVDTTFNPAPDNVVFSICLQTDGSIVIGGAFTQVNNDALATSTSSRNYMAKYNTSNNLDSTFDPNPNANVLRILEDGTNLLVSGAFSVIDETNRELIARIDGTTGQIDPGFEVAISDGAFINQIKPLSGGKILIGGNFAYEYLSQERRGIAKINQFDGSFAADFETSSIFLYEYDFPSEFCIYPDESQVLFGGLIQGGYLPMVTLKLDDPISQTITFPAITDKDYQNSDDRSFELAATTDSGLAVSFRVVDGFDKAFIDGNKLKIYKIGSITIAAVQPGNDTYSPAPAITRTFNAFSNIPIKSAQQITFSAIANTVDISESPITLNATSSSGLPVSFSVVKGDVTVEGNEVILNGTGLVVIQANQTGDESYEAAPSVMRTFTVISS